MSTLLDMVAGIVVDGDYERKTRQGILDDVALKTRQYTPKQREDCQTAAGLLIDIAPNVPEATP